MLVDFSRVRASLQAQQRRDVGAFIGVRNGRITDDGHARVRDAVRRGVVQRGPSVRRVLHLDVGPGGLQLRHVCGQRKILWYPAVDLHLPVG